MIHVTVPVDGVSIRFGIAEEDAAKVIGWSTSEVSLYLGSGTGLDVQNALRRMLIAEGE